MPTVAEATAADRMPTVEEAEATAADDQPNAAPTPEETWQKGDLVKVDGRVGTVTWDGRPKHAFASLKWEDDGTEAHLVAGETIQFLRRPVQMTHNAQSSSVKKELAGKLTDQKLKNMIAGQITFESKRKPKLIADASEARNDMAAAEPTAASEAVEVQGSYSSSGSSGAVEAESKSSCSSMASGSSIVEPSNLTGEILKSGKKDPRHDFGIGLGKRCSVCRKFTLNRGDRDTRKVYCVFCFWARPEGKTAALADLFSGPQQSFRV